MYGGTHCHRGPRETGNFTRVRDLKQAAGIMGPINTGDSMHRGDVLHRGDPVGQGTGTERQDCAQHQRGCGPAPLGTWLHAALPVKDNSAALQEPQLPPTEHIPVAQKHQLILRQLKSQPKSKQSRDAPAGKPCTVEAAIHPGSPRCRGVCRERKAPSPHWDAWIQMHTPPWVVLALATASWARGGWKHPRGVAGSVPHGTAAQSTPAHEPAAGERAVVSSLAGEPSRGEERLLTSLSNFPTSPAPKIVK